MGVRGDEEGIAMSLVGSLAEVVSNGSESLECSSCTWARWLVSCQSWFYRSVSAAINRSHELARSGNAEESRGAVFSLERSELRYEIEIPSLQKECFHL